MSVTADKVIVELEARLGKYNADVNAARANFDSNMGKIRSSAMATERQAALSGANLGKAFGGQVASRVGGVGVSLAALGPAGIAAAAGILVAGAALGQMQQALKVADDLDAISTKLGITAEQYQELTFAAHENDITTESLTASLEGLNASLGAYKSGVADDRVKKVFETLGITPESLAHVNNAAELLPILADKIKGLQSTAERVKIAKALGVEDMVPLLAKGGEEIARLAAKARDLGLVMSNELTTKAADANRELEVMGEYMKAHLSIAFASMGVWVVDLTKKLGPLIAKIHEATDAWAGYWQKQVNKNAAEDLALAAKMEAENGGKPTEASTRLRNSATLAIYNARTAATDRYAGPVTAAQMAGVRAPVNATPDRDGGGGGGGRSPRSSAPRFGGPLPDYILKGVADGRYTEASIREWYPDGNFPKDGFVELPPAKTFVEAVDAASKAETIAASSVIAIDETGGRGFKAAGEGIAEALGPATEAYATMRQNFASAFADGAIQALQSGDVGGALEQMLLQYGMQGLRAALEGLGSTLFSMGSGGPLGSGGSTLGDLASSVLKLIPGFASGTSSAPGGLAYVHKDELINLPKGSQVYTAAQTRAMTRGGGGSQPVMVSINMAGANGDRTIAAIARQATMQGVSAGLNAANRSETGRRFTETLLGARPL